VQGCWLTPLLRCLSLLHQRHTSHLLLVLLVLLLPSTPSLLYLCLGTQLARASWALQAQQQQQQ
jgi:hypothetical protein